MAYLKRYVLFFAPLALSVPSLSWSGSIRIDWTGEISTGAVIPHALNFFKTRVIDSSQYGMVFQLVM